MPRIITGLIFLSAIFVYYPVYAAVKVVESTPSRLVLGWEIGGFDTVSFGGADGIGTRISFDGGYIELGDSGAPLLLGYSIYAGVPAQGGVRVSVEPEETAVLRLANPLQKRTSAPDALSPAYSSAAAWISEPSYTRVRDCRAVYLALRPVIMAGQGGIQVLRKARIVINFPPAPHSGVSSGPRGDYERMAKRLLLNYGVAQGWRESGRALRKSAADMNTHPLFGGGFFSGSQKLAAFKVGDGSRNEGTTKENTLVRIGGKKVRELYGSSVPINSVALYASLKGEMAVNVPKDGEIPDGVFEIPLLRYDVNGNGRVDDGDYFIAYVSGASDWSYESKARQFSFAINRYDDYRTYWLTVKNGAGVSMGGFAQPPAGAQAALESFDNYVFIRSPSVLAQSAHEGGIDYAWQRFSTGRTDTAILLDLPGIDERYTGTMWVSGHQYNNFDCASCPYGKGSIEVSLGGRSLCANCDGEPAVSVAGWGGDRDLSVKYADPVFSAKSFYDLNSIRLRYRQFLSVSDAAGRLQIFSDTADGAVRYRLSKNGTGLAYIVRVPLDEREISLIDTVRQEREYLFSDNGNMGIRYMVMYDKDIIDYSDSLVNVNAPPAADNTYQIRNLRNTSNRSDYLIVAHGDFLGAALKLAAHKEAVGFRYPKVIILEDVLNQFGGGNTDPSALRNFLLYAYRYWEDGTVLSYVTLLGSGHYDYKKVSTSSVNFMPVPYINNAICDDYYVFFDTSRDPSDSANEVFYFIGRLPAKSPSEALDMVEKIRETEMPGAADFGAWRNKVIMAADDDQQGSEEDNIGLTHYWSSELSANVIANRRPDVDLQKIYLFEYPWDERYSKPGATRALINEINGGAAVVNWFGHGSSNQLADEMLFAKSDVTALNNYKRYPIISLFSCSIGKFDNPRDDCLASMLVRQPKAGAIVVLSSAREVFPTPNEKLALPFFEALFDSEDHFTVGAALKMAKYRYHHAHNRYYFTLGDPSIALTARNRAVNISITDAEGRPVADTLRALQQLTIGGDINIPAAGRDAGFNGFVSLTLFNPPDTARRKDGGKYSAKTPPKYTLPGSPVYSAKIQVDTGKFQQQLILPMNVAFNKPGVRLIAYAWKDNDTLAGAGIRGGLIFHGSERGSIEDTLPPNISIRPVYSAGLMDSAGMFVKNRVTSRLPLTLEISVRDSSGINVIGSGPDEGLTLEVKGALSKRSINHLFKFENYMQGVATVPFETNSISSGTHELIISAQDLLGNVSKQSFTLEILGQAELKLDHVLNIPNPVRMGRETRFFYYHSNTPGGDYEMNVAITIRIYSLGGRLLAVIRNPRNGEAWIPRDQRGNILTPNVYLYQITASSSDINKSVKSRIKKLVVHPPR